MKDTTVAMIYMLSLWASIFILAFKEEPYFLAAAIGLLIVKQLGRIRNTLGDER